jgi:hypothetical protein
MAEQPMHTTTPPAPWYRQRWPWLLMLPPLAAVVGGIVTIVLAVRSNDGMVAADYYKRGLAINAELSRSQHAAELGLAAEVRAAGEGSGDNVYVRLNAERAMSSEPTLRIRLVHPGRSGADRVAVLARVGGEADGRSAEYRGAWDEAAQLRVPVAWRVVLEGRDWRLDGGIAAGEVREFRMTAPR